VTTPNRRVVAFGFTALWLVPLLCGAQSGGSAQIEYRGEKFKLTKSYASFEDYKNDPDNLDPAEIPRIERLITQAKIGPEFAGWSDFSQQAFAIKFPGYGFGGGPAVKAANQKYMVRTIEIPRASKQRYFVLQLLTNGHLHLVDDFVFPDEPGTGAWGASAVEIVADELVYFGQDNKVVRSAKISGEPLELRVREEGGFEIEGRLIATEAGLQQFMRSHQPAKVHVAGSAKSSVKQVERAAQAVRNAVETAVVVIGKSAQQ